MTSSFLKVKHVSGHTRRVVTSANGLHLASETLLLVSLCLLDNIIHDLNLPAINE